MYKFKQELVENKLKVKNNEGVLAMIKLMATDMDGTFLRQRDGDYDRPAFVQLFRRLHEAGIAVVIASGNPYEQLISFFPELVQHLFFVSDNGARVHYQGQELAIHTLTNDQVNEIQQALSTSFPELFPVYSGQECAYGRADMPPVLTDYYRHYFPNLSLQSSYSQNNLKSILRVALSVPLDQAKNYYQRLLAQFGSTLQVVMGANDAIDLQPVRTNKASGLQIIAEKLKIMPEEMVAFGDSANDLEMLNYVGRGYAMETAQSAVKAVSSQIIDSSDTGSVQQMMAQILARQSLL